MNKTLWHFLPALAAVWLLQASPSLAGTTYTYTAVQPETAGDWTHDFSFPQFNPSLGSLDAVQLTATFDLSTSATLYNTDQSSKVFWFEAGALLSVKLPGTLGQIQGSSFGPQMHYKLPGFGSASYGPFSTNVSLTLTLTGADLAPFVGTGTLELPLQTQMQDLIQDLNGGGGKINVALTSTSSAALTLQYLDAQVPEPSPGAMFALAFGLLWLWLRRVR